MPKNRRQNTASQGSGGIAGQLLGLSLFIMMLAFFIVLNSISSFDDAKVQPVSGSLEQAFGTRIDLSADLSPALTQDPAQGLGEGKTLDRVEGLFKAELTNVETVTSRQRGVMYMRLKRPEFEAAVKALEGGQQPRLVRTLASLLRSADRQPVYLMEIVYNLPDNPARLANRKPQDLETAIQALSVAAATIEQAGLPAGQMSVGLQKGNVNFVELTFRPLEERGDDVR